MFRADTYKPNGFQYASNEPAPSVPMSKHPLFRFLRACRWIGFGSTRCSMTSDVEATHDIEGLPMYEVKSIGIVLQIASFLRDCRNPEHIQYTTEGLVPQRE